MSIRLFIGVPGAGKTLAMQDYTRALCASGWPCLVIDRADEWRADDNPRWRGHPPEVRDVPHTTDLGKLAEDLEGEKGVLRFNAPWEPLDVAHVANLLGNTVYVDDEIDLAAVYVGWRENPIRNMVHRGRHLPNMRGIPSEVHILGAARRPQNLHTDLTSMADEVMLFRVNGAATLKRVVQEGYVEDPDEVVTLPNLDYVLWKSDGTRTPGRIIDPFKK